MKFHNQRSFMGHEISNVNNKPLLRKKGKQWIVVAVSALILAGFGGMVSTTTHADTTNAQPTTTKVAPKPANNSGDALNVMKQAQGMHKTLANNVAVQKPSVPNSASAKKTAPASATSTTSAKSGSNVSSSSSNSSNSSKATKPDVHMMLMTATPTVPKDNLAPQGVSQTATGKWNNDAKSATWNLYANGQLDLHDGTVTGGWPNNLNRNSVKYFNTSNITNSNNLPFGNASAWNMFSSDQAIKDINLLGLPKDWKVSGNWGHGFCDMHNVSDINLGHPDTSVNNYFDTMFANDTSLKSIEGLQYFDTSKTTNMSNMFYNCPQLKSLDLSSFDSTHVNNSQPDYINGGVHSGNYDIFKGDTSLSSIKLGSDARFEPDSGISPYAFTPNTNIATTTPTQLDDDSNNKGTWSIYQHGTWGTANWYLSNGTLLVVGNTITNDPNNDGIKWSDVNSIVTNNVNAPSNGTNLSHSFSNIPHVTSIDLSGINNVSNVTNMSSLFQNDRQLSSIKFGNNFNTDNVTDMNNMFAGDWSLQTLNLPSKFDTRKASMNSMFDSDSDLTTLSLPSDFQNNNNSTNLFGFKDTKSQVTKLQELTLGSTTYLGPYVDLPYSNWTQESDSKDITSPATYDMINVISTNDLESAKNHSNISKPWRPIVNDKVIYQYKGLDVPEQNIYNPSSYKPFGIKGTSNDNINWTNYTNGLLANHMPNNWNVISNDSTLKFNYDGGTHNVSIVPNQASSTINFVLNNKRHSSILSKSYNGQIYNVEYPTKYSKDSTFNVSNSIPAGYKLNNNSSDTSFEYGDGFHTIVLAPNTNTVNINYKYNGYIKGHHQFSGNDYRAITAGNNSLDVTSKNDTGIPNGYQLVNKDNTFNYDGSTQNVPITPIQKTDTIYYKNGTATVSSASFYGNDVSASGASNTSFTVSAPSNYSLSSGAQSTFNFNGSNYSVSVVPSTITINYMDGNNKVGSYSANTMTPYTTFNNAIDSTSAGSLPANSVAADVNLPAGYSLVKPNSSLSFDNSSYNIAVKPSTKTDVLNYMNGDVKVASDVYTGDDMYAPNVNHTSFNANDYVPAGYHVVNDGGNTFYFDGQTHDVTVYPNSITLEFNNGQAGSKKVDNLKGTTYQIKISDVPANYQLTNPSDNVVDLSNLGKSTDYNVDVSPIQQPITPSTPSVPSTNVQPSVPYVPSMLSDTTPVSSVASASSASSAVAMPSSVALQTSVAPSASTSVSHYSHYRYTKVITPLQLHTSKHFTKKNGVLTIKHPTSFKIMKIVHDHKLTRYEVKYQGHSYFITANDHFTINNYVQKHDFKSHKHMMVKVITPMIEYKHAHFNKKNAIRVFKKGAILPVKKVFTIGKGEMTRFELTNGRFVTSNKLFVKVIK